MLEGSEGEKQPMRKAVAIIGGIGLGDCLIEMVLAENARRCGYRTTVFSDVLLPLAVWFPQHRMEPSLAGERLNEALTGYAWIFKPKPPDQDLAPAIRERWVDYERMYRDDRTQVDNMVDISQRVLAPASLTRENGIVAPGELSWRRFNTRVCIHPTSAERCKNWLPARFLRLADRLAVAGFVPVFIMSEREVPEWIPIIGRKYPLHGFSDVAACAAFVYESGFFVGNDSGGGHLASCLRIPTVSIHGRKGKSRRWQPGWGEVEVVTPLINLVGGFLRQHCWKYFLPVQTVERCVHRLAGNTLPAATDADVCHRRQGNARS